MTGGTPVSGPAARAVQEILGWWAAARIGRDELPWRSTRDPWLILVAETMLAQTQTGRAAQRFPEFVARFPTARSCALAPTGEIVRLWSGLGYNRRALTLHRCAGVIVERHGGEVPSTLAELLELPGVGPYTARAVRATAFELPAAVVDTNVGRVLARAFAGSRLAPSEAQGTADRLLPLGEIREWNLALMDFGSLVCSGRAPHCAICPLASARVCSWRQQGSVPDPAVGSAGVSVRQSAFVGSDREGRGRLVRSACAAPVPADQLAEVAGWPSDQERALGVARGLVGEGLLEERGDGSFALA